MLVLSVAVGVCILTTALSLTNGFEQEMVDRILGTTPHVTLYNPLTGSLKNAGPLCERLVRQDARIEAAAPFVQGQALLIDARKQTVGVILRGVDVELARRDVQFQRYLVSGKLEESKLTTAVVLGSAVARKLQVVLGDELFLVTGAGQKHRVVVSGLFESGLYDFDAHVALTGLLSAQRLCDMGDGVSGVGIKLKNVFAASAVSQEWADALMLGARSWMDQNRPLLQAMWLERVVIFIVIMFIVLVAMMGIGSTMAMWVIERRSEISLLRAIGVSARGVGTLFVLQGTVISVLGVLLGASAGVLLSLALAHFPIPIAQEVYFLSHLPVIMRLGDFLTVGVSTLLLSPIASVLPALRAMRLDPVEILRRH
jgi:lipoprotein-releasing system permease protein